MLPPCVARLPQPWRPTARGAFLTTPGWARDLAALVLLNGWVLAVIQALRWWGDARPVPIPMVAPVLVGVAIFVVCSGISTRWAHRRRLLDALRAPRRAGAMWPPVGKIVLLGWGLPVALTWALMPTVPQTRWTLLWWACLAIVGFYQAVARREEALALVVVAIAMPWAFAVAPVPWSPLGLLEALGVGTVLALLWAARHAWRRPFRIDRPDEEWVDRARRGMKRIHAWLRPTVLLPRPHPTDRAMKTTGMRLTASQSWAAWATIAAGLTALMMGWPWGDSWWGLRINWAVAVGATCITVGVYGLQSWPNPRRPAALQGWACVPGLAAPGKTYTATVVAGVTRGVTAWVTVFAVALGVVALARGWHATTAATAALALWSLRSSLCVALTVGRLTPRRALPILAPSGPTITLGWAMGLVLFFGINPASSVRPLWPVLGVTALVACGLAWRWHRCKQRLTTRQEVGA